MKFVLALMLAMAAVVPQARAQDVADVKSEEVGARTKILEEAMSLIQAKKPAEAIALLEPLLGEYEKMYGDETRTVYCAMSVEELTAYFAKAEAEGRRSLAIEPGWCFALWAKGYALVDLDRSADSIPFLERAVLMAPSHSHFLSELGQSYQTARNFPKALEIFTRSAEGAELIKDKVQHDRELGRAWRGMGFNLIELGRWAEAEALFRKCLELDPNDQKAKNELDYIAQHKPKN